MTQAKLSLRCGGAAAVATMLLVVGACRREAPTSAGHEAASAPQFEAAAAPLHRMTCTGGAKPVLSTENQGHTAVVTCPDGARQAVVCKGLVVRSHLYDDGRFFVECPEAPTRRPQP
jgi:hypothetical protein